MKHTLLTTVALFAAFIATPGGFAGQRPCVWLLREGFHYQKWDDKRRIDSEPAGWDRHAGESARINPADRLTGDGKLEVNAPAAGFSGWLCNPLELIAGDAVRFEFEVARSADFAGARPMIRILFLDRNRQPLKEKEITFEPPAAAGTGVAFSGSVEGGEIPADTAYFQLFLGCRAVGGASAGKLWFERASLGREHGFFLPRTNRYANWFYPGETVTVTPAEGRCAPEVEAVTGIVRDSQEKELFRKTVSAAEFRKNGWAFLPPGPGFYQVEFLVTVGGSEFPAVEEFTERTIRSLRLISLQQRYFPVAVSSVPRDSLPAKWLGVSVTAGLSGLRNGPLERGIRVGRLLGGNFVRFHGPVWPELEPEKGKFDFYLDKVMKDLGRDVCSRSVLNVWGTPRWASSQPDRMDLKLGNRVWKIVKPANGQDTRDFWKALVRHYKAFGIKRYEVWNEPHLPGYSCFWNDTPEHFVEMLRDAAAAIREEDPEAEIWLGGIGQRYLVFYEKILSLGARKYFDVVPLHGRDYDPATFRAIDRKLGVEPPVYSSSEWHTVLITTNDYPPNPESTEREISKVMLLDLLRQKRQGIREVTAFGVVGYLRKEGLRQHDAYGNYRPQSIGLFDSVPYLMPRHCALALGELAAKFPESLDYVAEYRFGAVKAALFRNAAKPVLVVWHDGGGSIPCPAELKRHFSAQTRISDWEGKPVDADGFRLEKDAFYYLDGLAALPPPDSRTDVLSPERPQLKLAGPTGKYGVKPLIGAAGEFLPANAKWNEADWGVRSFNAPFQRKARFALALADGAMQLVVENEDPIHMPGADAALWNGDSLQFALDTAGKGHVADHVEFVVGKRKDGVVRVLKLGAPALGGDLPGDYTVPGNFAGPGTVTAKVEEIPGGKRYLVRLKLSELYPLVASDAESLRFSLLINENDGKGRLGYLHWADGIGNGKDPVLYGTLHPATP